MIEPRLSDERLLADIHASRQETDRFHLWWLGQSGFLLQWRGRHALLDPYLSDSLTRKYEGTDRPHVRMSRRVVAPERLDFVDVVTSSHEHTDHMDPETLQRLAEANPGLTIVFPEAGRRTLIDRLGRVPARLAGMDAGSRETVGVWTLDAVPSAHETIERDAHGRHRFLGYVVRFGNWTVYHSGDTVLYDGLAERLRSWRIDVALLPINGRAAAGRVAGNLDGEEAVALALEAGIELVIPCHYDMFTFNTAPPQAFVTAAARAGQAVRVLELGERFSSEASKVLAPTRRTV